MVEDAVAGVVGGLAAGCVLGGVYDGMHPLSMILRRISMSGGRRRIFRLGRPSGSRSRRLDATGRRNVVRFLLQATSSAAEVVVFAAASLQNLV